MPGTSYLRETLSIICSEQAACDGNYIQPRRMAQGKTICGTCEKALAKRGKSIPPRGINYKEGNDG